MTTPSVRCLNPTGVCLPDSGCPVCYPAGAPDARSAPEPTEFWSLRKDEIARRLAIYAISIDGFDSLTAGMQDWLLACAQWICDQREAVLRTARPPVPSGVEIEALAREVHAAWRDGMLAQERPVSQQRMTWETLDERDRLLDREIAIRLAARLGGGRGTPGETLESQIERLRSEVSDDSLFPILIQYDGNPEPTLVTHPNEIKDMRPFRVLETRVKLPPKPSTSADERS